MRRHRHAIGRQRVAAMGRVEELERELERVQQQQRGAPDMGGGDSGSARDNESPRRPQLRRMNTQLFFKDHQMYITDRQYTSMKRSRERKRT